MVKIYKQPFAHGGDAIAIPDTSQPDGKMSSADGWTPDYQLPKTDPNYKPVGRQEMNGVFKEVTEALGQVQVQGSATWSADGAPYPIRAQVYHNSKQWLALRANSVEPTEGDDWTELYLEPGPDDYALFSLDDKLVWKPVKQVLTAPLDIYVDANNGNDENPGDTLEYPKKTIFGAFSKLASIDSGMFTVNLVLLPGEYKGDSNNTIPFSLGSFPSIVVKAYDTSDMPTLNGSVFISGSGNVSFESCFFSFTANAHQTAIPRIGALYLEQGPVVSLKDCSITLKGSTSVGIRAVDSGLVIAGGCAVTSMGSCLALVSAERGGSIQFANAQVAINGACSLASMLASRVGDISFYNSTLTGTVTGKRYYVTTNGVIDTSGGGENFIPGTIAGTKKTGGQYV